MTIGEGITGKKDREGNLVKTGVDVLSFIVTTNPTKSLNQALVAYAAAVVKAEEDAKKAEGEKNAAAFTADATANTTKKTGQATADAKRALNDAELDRAWEEGEIMETPGGAKASTLERFGEAIEKAEINYFPDPMSVVRAMGAAWNGEESTPTGTGKGENPPTSNDGGNRPKINRPPPRKDRGQRKRSKEHPPAKETPAAPTSEHKTETQAKPVEETKPAAAENTAHDHEPSAHP